jgi:two-component system sensor histidine kinase MtrB
MRTIGGTGLGLAIALEDAMAHGGMLDVWSRPGQGTVFRLTLPRTTDTTAIESPLPLSPEDAGAEGPLPTGAMSAVDAEGEKEERDA